MEEEKKKMEAVEAEIISKDPAVEEIFDDGFTDDHPYVPTPAEPKEEVEEPVVEEAPSPLDVEADVVVEDEEEDLGEEFPISEEFDDPALQRIEDARVAWMKDFRLHSRIRTIISIVVVLAMLGGGLLPIILIKDQGLTPLYIGLGIAVVGAIGLLIYNSINRRRDQRIIGEYFEEYYAGMNQYTLANYGIDPIEGAVKDRIDPEEFKAGGAFEKVDSIGSRDNVTFEYEGMSCALADAAGQKDNGKSLETVFVGKFLRTHNQVECSEEGLFIYFKGNDRALVPDTLQGRHALEKSKSCIIYGDPKDKNALTMKQKKAIRQIRTDDLLVDVSIAIKPGKTYWYLGYEDTIMVLPSEKTFNPVYLKKYKQQLKLILDIAKALNE